MKKQEDTRLLDHKRAIDEQRRAQAIDRQRQARLRAITPGTATPATVFGGAS
jgi:hypothetical protein